MLPLTRFIARMANVRPARLAGRRALASITFDDFPKSAWTVGGPVLARHGVRGTYYTAGSFCGRTVNGTPYYDAEDLSALAAAGHEIACHGFGHRPTPLLSTAELADDLARNAEFLAPFLGGGRPDSYAYPYGASSLRTKHAVGPRFASARGTHQGLNLGRIDLAQLNAFSLETRLWNPRTLRRAVEKVRARKGWIVFYTHQVCEDPGPYGSTPAMLSEALSSAAAAGLDILPMREAVRAALGENALSQNGSARA